MQPELYLLPAGKLLPLHDLQLPISLLLPPALMLGFDLFRLRGVTVALPAFHTEGLEVGLAIVLEDDELPRREGLIDHIALEIFIQQLVDVA